MSARLATPAAAGSPVLALVRDDLRGFAGYRSARSEGFEGRIWLNANESAWRNVADPTPDHDGESDGDAVDRSLRRYPDPQPDSLRGALADLYGCRPQQLLVGRGSDEAIDLLVRALCRPGADAVVVTPPTFGMYAVAARLHGAKVVEVPLRDTAVGENGGEFACDFDALANAAVRQRAKIVFLCSPGNPTGSVLSLSEIVALARRLQGQALVVVDEAYIEYADRPSAVAAIEDQSNLAVLRTLSKAHALAAARIGCVIAAPELITVLRCCQAPYPLPAPCVAVAESSLGPAARAATSTHVATTRRERERVLTALASAGGVRRLYRSQANFILARFEQAQAAFERLLAAGIVVRDLRATPGLDDALRISIGTLEQNDAVLEALGIATADAAGSR